MVIRQEQETPLIGAGNEYSQKPNGVEIARDERGHNPNGLLEAPEQLHGHLQPSRSKLYAVIALFVISLISFVSQTELTSYLYKSLDFNQPVLLLVMTHSSWILIWPLQVLSIMLYKHVRRCRKFGLHYLDPVHIKRNFAESFKNQHRNIFKTSTVLKPTALISPSSTKEFIQSEPIKFLTVRVFILSIILNVAGLTWYVSMQWSPASDITAIYNCSAFTALVFAIPILNEKFTYTKLFSVLLAVFGVFCVAFGGDDEDSRKVFPRRVLGDIIITFGAILYGLYEVLYKRLMCPPVDSVSSRRLMSFSNFCASLIGLATFSIGWIFILVADITGISKFRFITSLYSLWIIWLSVVSNLVFSLSFLGLMSLTSPVLSSVSSLVTILFVGLFEWLVFGVSINLGQLLGNLLVVVGFVVLSYSYWKEITEEDVDDTEEIDPTDIETLT